MDRRDPSPPRPSPDPAPGEGRRQAFRRRLGSTLVLAGLVGGGLALLLLLGWTWPALLFIGILAILGLLECLRLFEVERHPALHHWTVGIGAAYLIVTSLYSLQRDVFFARLDIFFLCLHLFGAFVCTFFRPLEGRATLERLVGAVFALLYIPFLFQFLTRLLLLDASRDLQGGSGSAYLIFCILATKGADTGAYLIGSWKGRHKAAPGISPGKTWEGFGGAVLFSLAAGLLVLLLFRERLQPLNIPHVIFLSLILAAGAIAGDLAESVLKRCARVKDSGSMLPGIGGALDLIDSLCFTAPVTYLYLHLLLDGPPSLW